MNKKNKYKFILRSENRSYNILSVLETKNNELIILPRFAENYSEIEFGNTTKDEPIKNQHYTIHNSPNSKEGVNVIKHTLEFETSEPITTRIFTRALKHNNLLCPLFLARCQDFKKDKYSGNFENDIIVDLGEYNPTESTLYYMLIIGRECDSFNNYNLLDINFNTIHFKQYSLSILWSYGRAPSHITGNKSHFLTLADENIIQQFKEGFSKDEIIHLYRLHRQIQHHHFLEFLQKEYSELSTEIDFAKNINFSKDSGLGSSDNNIKSIQLNYAYSLINTGHIEYSNHRYENALEFYSQGKKIFFELNEELPIADVYNSEGVIYHFIGRSETALNSYKNSLEIYKKLDSIFLISRTYLNIGIVYRDMSEANKALEYYEKSLAISQKDNYTSLLADAKREIGVIHKNIGEFSEAEEYLTEAKRLYIIDQNKEGEAFCLGNLGILSLLGEKFDKSLKFHQNALDIFIELNNRLGIANETANIGNTYCIMQQKLLGFELLIKASNLHKIIGYQYGLATDLKLLGFHSINYGQNVEGKKYLVDSMNLFLSINNGKEANTINEILNKL